MHKRLAVIATVASAASVWCANLRAEQIPIFVFAGQSNAVGYGTNSDHLSPAQRAAQPNVLFAQRPTVPVNWQNMQAPTEVNAPGGSVPSGHGFGPELTAPLTISNAHGSRLVGAVKSAENATTLAVDWNPNLKNNYSQMLTRVNSALSLLPTQAPGASGYVAGFFWMQGESDADEFARANAYEANLTNFIARVRQDFGNPNLPFIIGQVHYPSAPYDHIVRQAQLNVVSSIPHTYLALTDDLSHNGDGVHLSSAGTYDLGIRFGQGFNQVTSDPRWVGTSSDWNAARNWIGLIPDHVGAVANFGSFITSATTISTNRAVTVGTLRFSDASTYTIAGSGSITIDTAAGSGAINVEHGSHEIAVPLHLSDSTNIAVNGGARLALSGAIHLGSGTTLTKSGGGTLNLAAPLAPSGAAALALSGGTLKAHVSLHVQSLSVAAGAALNFTAAEEKKVLRTSSLVISGTPDAPTGRIDLSTNVALIDYTGASPLDQIRRWIRAGAAGGNGILSGFAAGGIVLAYAEASELGIASYQDEPIDSSTIIIDLALAGDANLDGTIDARDLGLLASHWQQSSTWTGGDFNYDGTTDIADLGILTGHWQQSAPLAEALASLGLGALPVPEPAGAALLLGAAMIPMRRRSPSRA